MSSMTRSGCIYRRSEERYFGIDLIQCYPCSRFQVLEVWRGFEICTSLTISALRGHRVERRGILLELRRAA